MSRTIHDRSSTPKLSYMRIGFISQWFDPESGSAAIPGGIARALRAQQFDIQVITGYPNFPSGKIFPGYKQKFHSVSQEMGFPLHRVPLFPDHSQTLARRALSYSSFALTSSLIGLPALDPIDAYFVYSSPVIAGVGPRFASSIRKKPLLTYVPDLWPDSATASGIAGTGFVGRNVSKVLASTSRWCYETSDAVVATSELMRATLIDRGVAEDKVSTVYNWVDESLFHPRPRPQELLNDLNLQEKYVVMYAGNLGHLQGVMTFIESAQLLSKRDDIAFVFVGSGALESVMQEFAKIHNLANITFLGQQPMAFVAELIAASDVQLISLIDTPLLRMTVPSKLQYTMASGRPVIIAASGEAADLVQRSEGGGVVDPDNPTQLAEMILEFADGGRDLSDSRGSNAYQFYRSHLSESVGAMALTKILLDL